MRGVKFNQWNTEKRIEKSLRAHREKSFLGLYAEGKKSNLSESINSKFSPSPAEFI